MIFFVGLDPNQITIKFHELVGKPVLIPMWALGWHQSSSRTQNISELKAVLEGYIANDIPLEAQWSDSNYMMDFRDFTYDNSTIAYQGLPEHI